MHRGTDFPLPANLPRPADDGAADHLEGMAIPNISLVSTFGGKVELARLRAPRIVVYCYPMTGVPGKALPEGWDDIPGARGCTPQASNFQEQYGRFFDLGVDVFGLSTQSSEYQLEMAKRLNLPFEILSDAEFKFCDALRLPTFEVAGMRLLKRLTLAIRDARIEHVFYPVFPPDRSADEVLEWLNDHPLST
jgi:peroxiredoxin